MQIREFDVLKFEDGREYQGADAVALEKPLQILVNRVPYSVTMRTPGDDHDLVRGLLFTEGIVNRPETPLRFTEIPDPEEEYVLGIQVCVPAEFQTRVAAADRRSILSASSCGICGTRELKDVFLPETAERLVPSAPLDIQKIPAMMDAMAAHQETFRVSGGVHAAAAFTIQGDLLAAREDIGRHNAVDKVIGALLADKRLEQAECLAVSGRVSFEIVTKTFRAHIPFLLAVSAPSSLAVEMANKWGMTVLGFCRENRTTVYSHPKHVRGQEMSHHV
jgi:FdhD protein